jgi:hypothetical protein
MTREYRLVGLRTTAAANYELKLNFSSTRRGDQSTSSCRRLFAFFVFSAAVQFATDSNGPSQKRYSYSYRIDRLASHRRDGGRVFLKGRREGAVVHRIASHRIDRSTHIERHSRLLAGNGETVGTEEKNRERKQTNSFGCQSARGYHGLRAGDLLLPPVSLFSARAGLASRFGERSSRLGDREGDLPM